MNEYVMDLATAKLSLENEVKNSETDIQRPLNQKYAKWKIIDYLWVSCIENINDGDCIEWLKDLYKNAGMTEEDMSTLVSEVELILEVIRRNPLKKV